MDAYGRGVQCISSIIAIGMHASRMINKYFELKNSWGARAPLNLELLASNFPMYVHTFSKSDSWGYSIVVGLKDTSRHTRPLGLQEFQVSRAASHIQ